MVKKTDDEEVEVDCWHLIWGYSPECKVTPVIPHGVVSQEVTPVILHGVVSPDLRTDAQLLQVWAGQRF